jgi:hypothetical protein
VIRAETNLNIPPEKSDRARKMLQHGRSIDEVAKATKLSLYLVRRLRQQVMAAQIQKRNRKEAAAHSESASSGDMETALAYRTRDL